MDIRDYKYIVTIAEQKSITRAAAQLFITQSALTKFLQRTERNIGVPLFLRKGNQFLLTEAGQKYVETGRVIMQLDRQLEEQLDAAASIQKKRIRIGYGMGRGNQLIEEVIPAFLEKYPDIQICAKAETSRKQMMELQNGALDLVIVTNVEQVPGYTYLPIEATQMVVAASETSFLVEKANADPQSPFPVIQSQDLEQIPLVSMPLTTNSGSLAKELLTSKGIKPNIMLEVSDIRSLFDAVEHGIGAGLCMSVPLGTRKLKYLALEDAEPIEQLTNIVYRSDKTMSPAMKYLIYLIRKQQEGLE